MHHVFLSHASSDRDAVAEMCAALETQGISSWASFRDIPAGANWDEAIEVALREAASCVVAVTPSSVKSRYVRAEVEEAIRSQKTVIPVIVSPAELPLRWRTLQSITWDPTDREASARRLVADLPSTAVAQFLEALQEPSRVSQVRALLLRHAEWLPIDGFSYSHYELRTDVPIDSDTRVDLFAGRLDSSGPRAWLYYLGSPYNIPISGSGAPSNELLHLLRVARRHCSVLHGGLQRSHPLAPPTLLHEHVRASGPIADFYASFHVRLIVGRRIHYRGAANEVRQKIHLGAKEHFAELGLNCDVEVLSYDRLLDAGLRFRRITAGQA